MSGRVAAPVPGRAQWSGWVLLVLLCGLAVFGVVYAETLRVEQRAVAARGQLGDKAAEIERRVREGAVAARSLAMLVDATDGDANRLARFADEILHENPDVSGVQLAPGGVITSEIPTTAKGNAVGMDLLADPARRPSALLAIERRDVVVDGPRDLASGGRGLVVRAPAYLADGAGSERFWGFVILLIRVDSLVGTTLRDLASGGYHYRLEIGSASAGNLSSYSSHPKKLASPITRRFYLYGQYVPVELSIEPEAGWHFSPDLPYLAALLGLFLLAAGHQLLGVPSYLARRVSLRTLQLERATAARNSLFGVVRDSVICTDGDGLVTEWNPAAERTFGYSIREALGQPWISLVFAPGVDNLPPEAFEKGQLGKAAGKGQLVSVECSRRDGGSFPAEISITQVENGGDIQHIVHLRDVTVEKRAEESLIQERDYARRILDSMGAGLVVIDAQDGIVNVNEAFEALVARPRDAILGHSVFDLVHDSSRGQAERAKALRQAGVTSSTSMYFARGDEGRVHVHVTGAPVFQAGKYLGAVAVVTDLTERDLADAKASQQDALIKSIFAASPDVVGMVDAEGRFVVLSASVSSVLGYAPVELRGKSYQLLLPDDGLNGEPGASLLGQTSGARRLRMRARDGRVLTLDVAVTPIEGSAGTVEGYAFSARDVTAQVELQQQVIASRDAAERANSAKSEFLSRMSHELRTPMNAILGFGQLLERSELDARLQRHVGHILNAGRHLLALIDEVLDISRIESGRMPLDLEPVELRGLLAEEVALAEPAAARCRVSIHLEAGAPASVLADERRLRQVVANLLSNAIKYNREGGEVLVVVSRTPDGEAEVAVHDTGLGIPAAKLGKLFDPFDRLGAEATGIEGTGLGLYLTKSFVEAMGGRMTVASNEGGGSTFRFALPVCAAPGNTVLQREEGGSPRPLPATVDDIVVLHVEDDSANADLVRAALADGLGWHVVDSPSGIEALRLVAECPPRVILLDLRLGDIAGEAVLSALKSNPSTREVPVVVLTADAFATKEDLIQKGAAAVLTKPLDIGHLVACVAGLVPQAAVP